MPRGHEDWGINTEAVSAVSTPTNEINVRVGTPLRISRTGHVFCATTFRDDLLSWRITKHQSNGSVGVDRRKGVFESGSLQYFLATAVNGSVTLAKRLPIVDSPKWGLETIVWFNTGDAQFQARLVIGDGTNERIYAYEINSSDDQVKILDSDNVYDNVQALTIVPVATEDQWIYTKMIIDHDDNTYQSLTINDQTITTITQVPRVNANTDLPFVEIQLFIDNTAAAAYRFRIGSVALTVDEP